MADKGRATEKLQEMHADLARSESFRIEFLKHEISEKIYRAIENEGVSKAELRGATWDKQIIRDEDPAGYRELYAGFTLQDC